MIPKFVRFIAFRYLFSRKEEGFVSITAIFSFLGIMLGVATLIIVMSVMNGFRAELFDRILGLNGHITITTDNGVLDDPVPVINSVEKSEDVLSAYATVNGQALLSKGGEASGVLVKGYSKQGFRQITQLEQGILSGNLSKMEGFSVAIGKSLAEKFDLYYGDSITLIAPKGRVTAFGTIPRQRSFKIAAIFDVGMFEYNSGFVFMPISAAAAFYDLPTDGASSIEIRAKDISKVQFIKDRIAQNLLNNNILDSFRLFDWQDANKSFVTALEVERNVMFIILTLIIIVAAFNIISSMTMLVKDKAPDIAIMRTMGATKTMLIGVFMLTGASIGIAGTTIGAVIGVVFVLNIETLRVWLEALTGTELFSDEIYFLTQLPADPDAMEIIIVTIMALIITVLATLYPALKAANLNPVEILRHAK